MSAISAMGALEEQTAQPVWPGRHQPLPYAFVAPEPDPEGFLAYWILNVPAASNFRHRPGSHWPTHRGWAAVFPAAPCEATGDFRCGVVEGSNESELHFQYTFFGWVDPCVGGAGGTSGPNERWTIDGKTLGDYYVLPSRVVVPIGTEVTFTAVDGDEQEVISTWEIDNTEGVFPESFPPEDPSASVTFGSNEAKVYVVRGTKAGASAPSDESTVAFVDLQIVNKEGAPTDTLSVSMWENAFSLDGNTIRFDQTFINTDSRLFYVRLLGLNDVGDAVQATIATQHPQFGPPRGLLLTREEGFHQSQSMILVSNGVDDTERHGASQQVISAGSNHDRTILSRLGDSVHVTCNPSGDNVLTRDAAVPAKGTVYLRALVLVENGNQLIETRYVVEHLYTARETFAQIGVNLTWDIEFPSVPSDVILSDDLPIFDPNHPDKYYVFSETKSLVEQRGTVPSTDDIDVFYIRNGRFDETQQYFLGVQIRPGIRSAGGVHPSDMGYSYNVFINARHKDDMGNPVSVFRPFTLAHELTHLLSDDGDHSADSWNLMHKTTSETKSLITDTKRLNSTQEEKIHEDVHVK